MAAADEPAVLDLIGRVYDAAYEPSRWRDYLVAARDAFGATSANLILLDHARPEANIVAELACSAEILRDYEEHYWRVDALRPLGDSQGMGRAWSSSDLCAEAEFEKTEFCADFLSRSDLFYYCGGVLLQTGATQVVSGVMRSRRYGPFGAQDVRLAAALMPHLQRAVRLDRRLRRLEAERGALGAALERAAYAVVLLDADRQVVAMNRAAEEVIAAGDGLVLAADGLHAARNSIEDRFQELISNAVEPGVAGPADGLMALPRNSGRRPLAVFAAPMPARNEAWWTDGAAAILFVSDPEASPEGAARALMRLHGLTAMEARVAASIAEGRGLGETAEALGVSRHTAQAHLKAIFAKTGLHSQSQLARLVGSLAALSRRQT